MAAQYSHLMPDWPHYHWDTSAFAARLADVNFRRGALMVAVETLGFEVRQESVIDVLVQDVTRSSAIEGVHLDEAEVRSSVARRLGIEYAGLPIPSRSVEGVVEMMLDATQRYNDPLNMERIFAWHSALFPSGRSGMRKIVTGAYRDDKEGPMMISSGPYGRERIHFEAPAAERVPLEMERFFDWFERGELDPIIKAAVAHLWFETIHPMEDGNGRIGRAIMDLALARADGSSRRLYSMTTQMHQNRKEYYAQLELASRDTLDATRWIIWFLERLDLALTAAEGVLQTVGRKQAFWDKYRDAPLNERQIKIVGMLIDGFRGNMQAARYAKITKCSTDTALRDLTDMVNRGILRRSESGGRSTSYVLAH